MYKLKVKFEMAYAHRLINSYSKDCQSLHGHNGICEIEVGGEVLNNDYMVTDFKKLKEIVNDTLKKYDHSTILHKDDPLVNIIKDYCNKEKFHLFDNNPTAEYMCYRFGKELQSNLDKNNIAIKVLSFSFEETSNNKAIVTFD